MTNVQKTDFNALPSRFLPFAFCAAASLQLQHERNLGKNNCNEIALLFAGDVVRVT